MSDGTPAPTFDVTARPHPFRDEILHVTVPEGCTLAEIGAGGTVAAWVNGERQDDLSYKPAQGDHVLLHVVPQGGGGNKGALLIVASIALAAASMGTSLYVQGLTGSLVYGAMAGAAVGIVGGLLLNQLIPPPSQNLDGGSYSEFRAIQQTSNRINPFGAVPKLFGKMRVYPCYAALPVPVANGGQQDFVGLYCFGYKEQIIDETTFKLGETALSDYEDSEYRIIDWTRSDDMEDLFPFGAVTDGTSGDLKDPGVVVTRTTALNAKRVEIEVGGGPIGYWGADGDTEKVPVLVPFTVEYRETGSGDPWTMVTPEYVAGDGAVSPSFPEGIEIVVGGDLGTINLSDCPPGDDLGVPAACVIGTGEDTRTYTLSVGVNFPSTGQYDIRLTRLDSARLKLNASKDPELDYGGESTKRKQEISLIRLRYIVENAAPPIDPRFSYVALKLKASDQLNGAVDDFNAVSQGVANVWTGSAWEMQATSSPASAYREVMLGSANARPVSSSRVNDATLIAWAAACAAETPPREFCAYIDGRSTVFETLKSIAASGRASFAITDGKYGVVRDVSGLTPVQMFTPRNSWGFQGGKSYGKLPHALRVKFVDRDTGWTEVERVVYDDGYSVDGAGSTDVATLFENITLFGITHRDTVHKDARYHLAVARLRPETFSWNAAIENIVCTRGDVVRLQHDAMLVGLGAGRVIAKDATTITTDETFLIESGPTYSLVVRRDDGVQSTLTITNGPGETNVLTISGGVPAGIKVGDLVAFGEATLVTFDVLVTDVVPGADLTAEISAVPYSSPGVHNADTGTIPDYDPGITLPQFVPPAPIFLNVDSSAEVGLVNSTGGFTPRIFVAYAFPKSETLVPRIEAEYRPAGSVNWRSVGISRNDGTLLFPVHNGSLFDFRLRGLSPRGTPGAWTIEQSYELETSRSIGDVTLTLQEQVNNPATPNGDLSTVLVTTVDPVPSDPNYEHAYIDYRRAGDAGWTPVGATDANKQARIIVNSDGTTYQVRARNVNVSGVRTQYGTVEEITVSIADGGVPGTDPDAGAPTTSALNVSNLRVLGKLVAATTFDGQDAAVEWDSVIPDGPNTPLRDYRVRVKDTTSGQVMRVQYVVGTSFTYSLSNNLADAIALGLGYTTPRRALTFEVIARSKAGRISATTASKAISNPAPALPGDFAHSSYAGNLKWSFTRPADGDYVKAEVYASQTSGFTPGSGNLVYEGFETKPIEIGNLAAGTWYSRVLLYDTFGAGTISAQYSDVVAGDPTNDVTAPTAPTGLSLASTVQSAQLWTQSILTATWTAGTDNSGSLYYEGEYWLTSTPTKKTRFTTADVTYSIDSVQAGANYSLRVRSVDYSGNVSAFTATSTHTVAGDTTAPANATSLAATGGLDKVVVEWVNPADSDFLLTRLYRGTSAGFTANSGSLLAEVRGTVYVDAEVVFGTNYYYKTITVDVSGNVSAASSAAGPATPTRITPANVANYIADAALGATLFASGIQPVSIVSSLPAAGGYTGPSIVYNTTDGKLYRYSAGAWTAAVPTVDLTGTIATAQIADGAVIAAKISAQLGGGNLALNSSCELDTDADGTADSWDVNANGAGSNGTTTKSIVATTSFFGTKAQRWEALAVSGTGRALQVFQDIPFTAGLNGVFTAYVRATATARVALRINWLDVSLASLSTVDTADQVATGSFVRYSLAATAPASTRYARITARVFGEAAAPNRFIEVDNAQFEVGEVASAYSPRADEILAGSIGTTQIADNAITTQKIIANAITAAKIAANTITAAEIAALTITAAEIAANTITAAKIAANTITAAEIAANAITASELAADSVIAGKIAAGVITSTEIAAGAIKTDRLIVGDFTNLLENSDLELGNGGWALGGASVLNDATKARNGSYCIAVAADGSTINAANSFRVTCQEGDQFYGLGWVKHSAGATGAGSRVQIRFLDASGAVLSTINGNVVATSVTTYTAMTVASGPAPAGSASVQLRFNAVTFTAGTAYADDFGFFRVAGSALIQDAAIITAKIDNLAVTTAKIDNLAITNAKINDLDAAKITAGTIAAARIAAGSIDATKLNVTTLSAITADLGTITAGTVTGATIRTAASGARVQLDSTNGVRTIASGGGVTSQMKTDGSGFLGVSPGTIQWTTAGVVSINGALSMEAGSDIIMNGGSIYAGKSSFASTTAGWFIGYSSGVPKMKIGDATTNLAWNGTSLTVTGVVQTAATGQRVVLTSGNETEFYDDQSDLAATIGIKTVGTDQYYLTAGLAHSGTVEGNATQQLRRGVAGYSAHSIGVHGVSYSSHGVWGVSYSNNAGCRGSGLADNPGVHGISTGGTTGVGTYGKGPYGVEGFQGDDQDVGGSFVFDGFLSATVAPTHTARMGTLCLRNVGGVGKIYQQRAGGYGGSGATWVVIGNAT